MKADEYKLNEKYRSRVNIIAIGCEYEIIKKNKTTCWVKLWEDNKPTKTIYKNVRYSVLAL
jgi:hypothetical protein